MQTHWSLESGNPVHRNHWRQIHLAIGAGDLGVPKVDWLLPVACNQRKYSDFSTQHHAFFVLMILHGASVKYVSE